MSPAVVVIIIALYFALLLGVSHFVSRKDSDNEAFFRANKKSPWWIVAFGMLGSSISGVTFVSVPGMVRDVSFNYMQTVFGFFFGYVIIALVLLPLYYRLNLTSIYSYLGNRLGAKSYKTGASFFFIGKIIGAAARLYLVAMILQLTIFEVLGIPFWVNVALMISLIWLYTQRSGIKTIIWTDTIQTIIMLAALVFIIVGVYNQLDLSGKEITASLKNSPLTRIFVFDDWHSRQNFWKQFLSGMFIPIVMTGLDQDMMQKNLTIKTLKDAQKNMYSYGILFVPINFLFLILGALLLMLASQNGIALPERSDDILTIFATQHLGTMAHLFFIIGIVAVAFSSADSALAALTTSFSIDILNVDENDNSKKSTKTRRYTHIGVSLLMILIILIFDVFNNRSLIDAIYTIVSYTYGPLLGLFAFGLFTKRKTNDKYVPYIAIASPLICYVLNEMSVHNLGYAFGYELLMLNGLITFVGLYLLKPKIEIN